MPNNNFITIDISKGFGFGFFFIPQSKFFLILLPFVSIGIQPKTKTNKWFSIENDWN